ncbi:MAG: hypothetical protein IIC82_07865 [Chloroflexi bacterium]|nr:hypothetical protein [Chloroflexota bacterium]
MTIVPRRFTRVDLEPGTERSGPRPLPDFFDLPAFVVTGDPGAGKTTAFSQAANEEPNAEFVTVRDFSALSQERWAGKTLYLDALDEQRAKTLDGESILDRVRGRLDELGCPKFRLSCREVDWYGSSDVQDLSAVSPSHSVAVLRLEPLTNEDIRTIAEGRVPDPNAFIDEAENRGILGLLENPQTLDLMLRVVGEGNWPETRTELYDQACRLLAEERNEVHERAVSGKAAAGEVLHAAGHLCAVHLCAGTGGFALTRANAEGHLGSGLVFCIRQQDHQGAAGRRQRKIQDLTPNAHCPALFPPSARMLRRFTAWSRPRGLRKPTQTYPSNVKVTSNAWKIH